MTDQVGPLEALVTTCNSLPEALNVSHRITGSWRATAALQGVSVGVAFRVAKGDYEPRDPAIRLALGLPVSVETTPAPGVDVAPGSLALTSSRPCACGCRRSFLPRTWNQVRIPGHPRRR